MPWKEASVRSTRIEFAHLAVQPEANMAVLCRRFGISRKTGYKWLNRFKDGDEGWERNQSRRPRVFPAKVDDAVEEEALKIRREHPRWGGRKIVRRLKDMGMENTPAPSTIGAILKRRGWIDEERSKQHKPMQRFERERPNELWQMDFKGPIRLVGGQWCHPLTIVDDHSRYAVCVMACANQRTEGVKSALIQTFRRYGLPSWMLMDNGACWGGRMGGQYTQLNVWQIRLGIRLTHGRIYHPQTQGKNERFNRTLKEESLEGRLYVDMGDCQRGMDEFRQMYNQERPHEALGMDTPASRYQVSTFDYPDSLPAIEYHEGDIVRRVGPAGFVSYHKKRFHVGRAFSGEPVGFRPTHRDAIYDVYYCNHVIARIDLKSGKCIQK